MATSKKSSKGSTGNTGDSDEKAALQALDRIEKAVAKHEASAPVTAAVDLKQICKVYQQIKPWLETALKLVEKIPVYGKKVAAAIRILMKIADAVCPA